MEMTATFSRIWPRFTREKKNAPLISFLGSTAQQATNSKKIEAQLAETSGRLSRGLPLLLGERVEFLTTARVRTLVPLIKGEHRGFMVTGVAWSNEDAAGYARKGDAPSDYVVVTHLKAQSEPYRVELRVVRTIDARCVAEFASDLLPAHPKQAVDDLVTKLLNTIGSENVASRAPRPEFYDPPDGTELWFYLIRLEQLLAVRCRASFARGDTRDPGTGPAGNRVRVPREGLLASKRETACSHAWRHRSTHPWSCIRLGKLEPPRGIEASSSSPQAWENSLGQVGARIVENEERGEEDW